MGFTPPRCPNQDCTQHARPSPRFYFRRGKYHPHTRPRGVQRYRCRACLRSFSDQTFRHDYRDRRPRDNLPLFLLLVSGIGMRQAGRVLDMDVRAVQGKQRKMARMLAHLHDNLCPKLPPGRSWLLDEEETFEGASIRTLTMPVLIERDSWFVVATGVAPIRRLASAGSARRRRQDFDERTGPRRDESNQCVRKVLEALAAKVPSGQVLLHTDQKRSYATISRRVFGDRLTHLTTSGTLVRDTHNPLFPINTTLAMTRDNCGRLRRRSWLVSKKAACLQDHLALFTTYRNYMRRRFNRDREPETPAKHLGILPRNMRGMEMLSWRQDWSDLSIHPMCTKGTHTVRDHVAG